MAKELIIQTNPLLESLSSFKSLNQLSELKIVDNYSLINLNGFNNLESIKNWKANLEHQEAQRLGHQKWYSCFKTRISKVERDYGI